MRTLILFTSLFSMLAYADQAAVKAPLSPELTTLIQNIAMPDPEMDNNAYVMLMGFNAPKEADPTAIGQKIIEHNLARLVAYATTGLEDINDQSTVAYLSGYYPNDVLISLNKDYGPACMALVDQRCLATLFTEQTQLLEAQKNNPILYARYQTFRDMPQYRVYNTGIADPMPTYQPLIYFAQLQLVQALIDFKTGEAQKGFDNVHAELALSKRMLAGRPGLIDSMIGINRLLTQYHFISMLMDLPELNTPSAQEKLGALLVPLTATAQATLASALTLEQGNIVLYPYGMIAREAELLAENQAFMIEAGSQKVLTFDAIKTTQFNYDLFQGYIELGQLMLPDSGKQYRAGILTTLMENNKALVQAFNKDSQHGNSLGTQIMGFSGPSYQSYFERLYDLISYRALVSTKFKIIQAGLKPYEVAAFLEQLGDEGRHPYTLEPFIWDEQTLTLSMEWLEKKSEDRLKRHGAKAQLQLAF